MVKSENYKRELAFIFFSQRRIILLTALLVTAIALLVSFAWPPVYGAYGSILLKGKKVERNPDMLEDTQLRALPITKEDLYSEIEILTSDAVARLAIEHLRADGAGDLAERLAPTDAKRIKTIVTSLDARVVPTSNVIEITYKGPDRDQALAVLQAVVGQYVLYRQQVYNPETVSAFIAGQLGRYEQDLRAKNRQMSDFIEASGITYADKQIENNLSLKKELETAISQWQAQAIDLRAQLQRLDRHLAQDDFQFFTFVKEPGIATLATRLQGLAVDRASLLRRYRPDSPPGINTERELNRVFADLRREVTYHRDEIATSLASTEQKVNDLSQRVEAIDRQNLDLRKSQIALQDLEREARLLQFSYETFFKRNEESAIQADPASSLSSSYVTVLVPPTALEAPVFPRPEMLIPAGLAAGLIAGLSLGFLSELLNHTFKRPEDLDKLAAGIPLIFSLPLAARSVSKEDEEEVMPRPRGRKRRAGLAATTAVVLLLIGLAGGAYWTAMRSDAALPTRLSDVPALGSGGSADSPRASSLPAQPANPVADRGAKAAGEVIAHAPALEPPLAPSLPIAPSAAAPVAEAQTPSLAAAGSSDNSATAADDPEPAAAGDERLAVPLADEGAVEATAPRNPPPGTERARALLRGSYALKGLETGTYYLQVRSELDPERLARDAAALQEIGWPAVIVTAEVNGQIWHRLLAGNFTTKAEAMQAKAAAAK